jgi:hypothetical protein
MKHTSVLLSFFLITEYILAQTQPLQPTAGYGSNNYKFKTVIKINCDDGSKGFWLYLPENPHPDSAAVVVFNHSYGAYNPMCYGAWINHLVRRGNIVIFPRYQKNLLGQPSEYTANDAAAIIRAIDTLHAHRFYTQPELDNLFIAGHSFGGVIAANLASEYSKYFLPKPKGIFLACPGTEGYDSGRISSYSDIDSSIKMIIIIEHDDNNVDSSFALELFNTSKLISPSNKNLIYHFADNRGKPAITSSNSEPTSLDRSFDSGERGFVNTLTVLSSKTDATDYYCYWKLLDALIDCASNGKGCSTAFGNTDKQKFMGMWQETNIPVRPLEVK